MIAETDLMNSSPVGCVSEDYMCRCTEHPIYNLSTPTKLHRISLLDHHNVTRCSAQTIHSIPQTLTHKLTHFLSWDRKDSVLLNRHIAQLQIYVCTINIYKQFNTHTYTYEEFRCKSL